MGCQSSKQQTKEKNKNHSEKEKKYLEQINPKSDTQGQCPIQNKNDEVCSNQSTNQIQLLDKSLNKDQQNLAQGSQQFNQNNKNNKNPQQYHQQQEKIIKQINKSSKNESKKDQFKVNVQQQKNIKFNRDQANQLKLNTTQYNGFMTFVKENNLEINEENKKKYFEYSKRNQKKQKTQIQAKRDVLASMPESEFEENVSQIVKIITASDYEAIFELEKMNPKVIQFVQESQKREICLQNKLFMYFDYKSQFKQEEKGRRPRRSKCFTYHQGNTASNLKQYQDNYNNNGIKDFKNVSKNKSNASNQSQNRLRKKHKTTVQKQSSQRKIPTSNSKQNLTILEQNNVTSQQFNQKSKSKLKKSKFQIFHSQISYHTLSDDDDDEMSDNLSDDIQIVERRKKCMTEIQPRNAIIDQKNLADFFQQQKAAQFNNDEFDDIDIIISSDDYLDNFLFEILNTESGIKIIKDKIKQSYIKNY